MSKWFVATDPGRPGGDESAYVVAKLEIPSGTITILESGKLPGRKGENMRESITEMKKYRDGEGNVYGIEKTVRNSRWVVIRTNPGGNRKGSKKFCASGSPAVVQKLLDSMAEREGWKEVS